MARELDVSEYSLTLWKKAYLGQQKPGEINGEMKSPEEMAKIIREQHKEIEYLKKPARDLKKSDEHPGGRTESRYAMIEQLSVQYGVKDSCAALRVSRSAFYRWRGSQESQRAREQRELAPEDRGNLSGSCERYGSPRVTRVLRGGGACGWARTEWPG